jgi:hypothetical protein
LRVFESERSDDQVGYGGLGQLNLMLADLEDLVME